MRRVPVGRWERTHGITSARSARLVSNEAFRCIRAASSPADSGPCIFRWTQGVSEARPPACRAGALPLSYVSVWWSWVVSIHRLARFRRARSQLSYTTMGPAPGLEPGSTGLQSQCPSHWARPALLERLITPRRPGALLHRRPPGVAAACQGPA
jgi:hypothetical protein